MEVTIGGAPWTTARVYRVATNSFLAQGGDLYQTFLKTKTVDDGKVLLSDVVMEHLRAKKIGGRAGSGPARSRRPRRAEKSRRGVLSSTSEGLSACRPPRRV